MLNNQLQLFVITSYSIHYTKLYDAEAADLKGFAKRRKQTERGGKLRGLSVVNASEVAAGPHWERRLSTREWAKRETGRDFARNNFV